LDILTIRKVSDEIDFFFNEDICDLYSNKGKKLGKGRYGSVKLGVNKVTNEQVAIKIVSKINFSESEISALYYESKVMKYLVKHENIISLIDIFENDKQICMVIELGCHGDLHNKLTSALNENDARKYFNQMCSGILYCHSKYIAHRDLKPENIFLDSNDIIKIGDWGYSIIFHPAKKITTDVFTLPYGSPEIFNKSLHEGPEVDIWALGVILYYMVRHDLPFSGGDFDIVQKVKQGEYTPLPDTCSFELKDLIKKIFDVNVETRPNIWNIKDHNWCRNIISENSESTSTDESYKKMKLKRIERMRKTTSSPGIYTIYEGSESPTKNIRRKVKRRKDRKKNTKYPITD